MDQPIPSQDLVHAANAGNVEAQCELGIWYAEQRDEKSINQAKEMLLRAHEQGSVRAAHNLGVMEQATDPNSALRYFEEAAHNGYIPSMCAIGYLLWNRGEWKQATPWLSEAAKKGDVPSKYALAKIIIDTEKSELYHSAFQLAREAAETGFAEAQALLATIFHEGLGIEMSPPDAVYWWQRAAYNDHAGAQAMLGVAYHIGKVFEKDIVQAAQWIMRSARQGNEIGVVYWNDIADKLTDEQYEEAKAFARRPLIGDEPDK